VNAWAKFDHGFPFPMLILHGAVILLHREGLPKPARLTMSILISIKAVQCDVELLTRSTQNVTGSFR
jgi:hypothetical protein